MLAGIVVVTILVSIALVEFFRDFVGERRYIKLKMKHSGQAERKYLKRKLRKLYIRSIPLIGPLLDRIIK